MFIEKLCCLSCEQLSGLPSTDPGQQVVKVTAAVAQMAATGHHEINLRHTDPAELAYRTSGYSCFFGLLAAALSDSMRHSTQPQSALRKRISLHPAVVLVLKTSLALHESWDSMNPEQLAHTNAAVLRLFHFLRESQVMDAAVQRAPSRDGATTRTTGGSGSDVSADLTPRVTVSDTQLLRSLCRCMRAEKSLTGPCCSLMTAVVQGLFADRVLDQISQAAHDAEQASAVVALAHHISQVALLWMSDEQQQEQQQQEQRKQQQWRVPLQPLASQRQQPLRDITDMFIFTCNSGGLIVTVKDVRRAEKGEPPMHVQVAHQERCQ